MSDTKCSICGRDFLREPKETGGQTMCPATGDFVCFKHCFEECVYREKETSLFACLYRYRVRLKIFANPKNVKAEMERLKHKETQWLKTDYNILMDEYKNNPNGQTVNRAELVAVRTLLFYRQFGKTKNGPQI